MTRVISNRRSIEFSEKGAKQEGGEGKGTKTPLRIYYVVCVESYNPEDFFVLHLS